MPFLNFFRNLFGGGNSEEPRQDGFSDRQHYRDSFRKPIWQMDDDDDDIDDFRRHTGGITFSVFSDPFQVTRFYEFQMDNILKSLFSGFGDNMLPMHDNNDSIFGNSRMFSIQDHNKQRETNLRDQMLKPGYSTPNTYGSNKQDEDLDGMITAEHFSKIWNNRDEQHAVVPFEPRKQHEVRKFVSKEFFHRPDGTIEQKQITKDNEGNEEVVISRQMGEKMYTVTTRKDKNGVETKTEDLVNMDENELKNFTEKWGPPAVHSNVKVPQSVLDFFPWDQLFGPNPKL